MKNIHILPTDKPSKGYVLGKCIKNLSDVKIGQFTKTYYLMFDKEYFQPQNIYIISDEEIKEGTWSMSLCDDESYEEIYQCKKANLVPIEDRKIILTTDQDLIKDGVQAIDNEFLEWFVKNPSCEFVEVRKEKYSERFDNDKSPIGNPNTWGNRWLTIIPKEEQKKILVDMMKDDEELGLYDDIKVNRIKLVCKDCSDSLEDCTCIVSTIDFPRQETFEDYLQRLKDRRTEDDYKYTDEDFEKYKEYISDCCKSGMSVYKCLELMYFAEKDRDDQLFNRESRQEIKLEEVFNDEKKENIKKFIDEINNPSEPNNKLKQAFEKYSEYLEDYENKNTYEHGFKDGAKWQQEQYTIEEQHVGHTIDELDKEYIKGFNEGSNYYIERMYSEEEVIQLVSDWTDYRMSEDTKSKVKFNEWFEQFKKK